MGDKEFHNTFGEEIAGATQILDHYASQVCPTCGGECCHRIGCGFYSPRFKKCPIYEYRPPKCRLYYCSKITQEGENSEIAKNLTKVIQDRFTGALFFDAPASLVIYDWVREMSIEEEVRKIIQAFENESMGCVEAQERLQNLVCGER